VINGVAQTAGTPITVSASQLSQISFQSGVGNDDLYVQAFDGQIWGGWTKLSVNVANHLADVTANSMTVARGQSVSATSLFSVSDADNDAIVQYHFLDSSGAANGGHFMLNGVDQGAQSNFTISASQLSQLNFQTGVGSDTLYVQVFDGYGWSNWTQLHVDIANQVAVVTADPATVARGQSVSAASLFSVSDANNDSIIQYHFLDTSNAANSGHFVLNGVDQGAQSNFTISASQLAQLNFQTGVGSDTIYVQAFDGYGWSNWTQLHADVANHTAVASANTVSAGRGQSISAASLFSVTDADGDAVTQYQFYENTTAPTSGHFSINGIDQTMQGTINVSASQLAQTTFLTGSATDTLYVRAFDGYGWGDWTALHLNVTENAPVIGAATTVVNAGEAVAASSLFSVTDADNDAITEYQVWDHTASAASGHFVMNGVAQDAQTVIDVSAANLSQLNFQGGQLSDELYVRAFDGTMWSDWTQINVGPGTASVAPNSPVSIVGTAGNDILVSGTGSATMTGGGGADTFVFVQNFGTDTIADFQATGTSHGTLEFSQATFADLASVLAHATQVGTDVVIAADQHNSVTLKNVALANLTSSDIHII
jgi:hypothetical protein